MERVRIGIIGGGWRSEFFVRVAKEIPEIFDLAGVFLRNPEKAQAYGNRLGVPTFTDMDALLAKGLDYVILAVPRTATMPIIRKLYAIGMPILCETPPAATTEELNELWTISRQPTHRLQVAEQYWFQPYHSALLRILEEGYLGEVSNVRIAMIHGYHGINMMRRYLGVGLENCTISGRTYHFPVAVNNGRGGMVHERRMKDGSRDIATFTFDNGKIGFFDFSNDQYFSYIRTRHLNIQGEYGEINDLTVNYLTPEGLPVSTDLRRIDTGLYSNLEGMTHRGIMFHDRFVYRNRFEGHRLNDDELSVAETMYRMKAYVETGVPFYPLEEALQDAYLSLKLTEALETQPVHTEAQSWARM